MADKETEIKYNLVHLTAGREYLAPLVASQLFDQAECQSITKIGFAPQKVEAWVIGAMREYTDKGGREKISALRKRCPHVTIKMLNGIGRLNSFPVFLMMRYRRKLLGLNVPTIYHCRGEVVTEWALKMRALYPGDKVVLDVRGSRPAEYLYKYGIENPADATGPHLQNYNEKVAFLRKTVSEADAVTTVSNALKQLLITEYDASAYTAVVPCCVSGITDDDKRLETRREWGVAEDEIVVVYSGTTASYQHLEDLTIPFLKELAARNNKIRLAFFSPEPERIIQMLHDAAVNTNAVIVKNYPQSDVAGALSACDAGILIRKPTLVNRIANPVKIAEYMAAGLPIIIEKGVGGIDGELFERSLVKGVEIAAGKNIAEEAAKANDWLSSGMKAKRPLLREYVKNNLLWSSAIQVSRAMYKRILA